MSNMRAKFQVQSVSGQTAQEVVTMSAVCSNAPFGPNGESDDSTYARYTPSGSLSITINNPALVGIFKVGQKFYLDFTEAAE